MPDFIRLPGSLINLSHVRLIEFESGDLVLVHWATHPNRLVLRDQDAAALLNALERRYGVLSDAKASHWLADQPGNELDKIFAPA